MQCYKSVVALVEKALGRAAPVQRLNVLYALSAICRRSKALRGVRDKYGADLALRCSVSAIPRGPFPVACAYSACVSLGLVYLPLSVCEEGFLETC